MNMRLAKQSGSVERRRGVVLLAVMVVVAILTLAVTPLVLMTMSELKSSMSAVKMAQARAAADSGVHYVMALLASPENIKSHAGGNLFSKAEKFHNVAVPGLEGATFSIFAPDLESGGSTLVYGLVDEGGKLNINTAMVLDPTGELLYNMLMKVPEMTETAANSIVDWLDADSEARSSGAENDHYSGKSPPYRAKNGPADSLEELLLVEGVGPELTQLFGSDLNRNGVIDPDEEGIGPGGLGWSAFLTVHSRYLNLDASGQKLTYLNDSVLNTVYNEISGNVGDDVAKFIALYRVYGAANTQGKQQSVRSTITAVISGTPGGSGIAAVSAKGGGGGGGGGDGGSSGKSSSSSNTSTVAGALADITIDQILGKDKQASKKIESMFDLVNSQVSVPNEDPKAPATLYTSPLKDIDAQRALLPKLFEKATTSQDAEGPARINLNTAPEEVLMTLTGVPNSGLTEADVQNIAGLRPSPSSADTAATVFQSPAWLLTEANIKLDTVKRIEKYVTTRSQVYRLQVIGRIENGPSARIEAVIDINGGRPRLLFWRDLTEAGGTAVSGAP